jgi:8-oxo-dGTP diphosphatase
MTNRFRVVPAAYVLFQRESEVLLQLRQNTGYMDDYWAMAAAGHVEAGESVFDAAVRETREELGVDVRAEDLRAICTMHRTIAPHGPIDERVDFFFSCTQWSGEPTIAEPKKVAALQWFDLAALPSNIVPHEAYVISNVASNTVNPIVSFGF